MEEFRELRWSDQYKNLLATTSGDGLNVFSPDNDPNDDTNPSPNDMEMEF